ncbi:Structural maintenance of chromosomes protein 2 [Entophlyctis sp. JEL0112]|nr:Structural maintenance of chromosomes protein 2 [Entophlyctis sp. JEL0112]
MHIEEIVIDGFKSYATRTVISGWDRQFNAITGLNGSGKSNILDAICFVLGISSLSHVRAANLTDLIYKRGQAGITKATVTIVFNNKDKCNSPVGYSECDNLTVTRQLTVSSRDPNKYFINGVKKSQQDVAMLFQSVQLNINNPHFIIMQGRITKVLNMRPREILAMVEEAAGTRMFEDRKEKAEKAIGKKEVKMEEIRNLLESEIQPKMMTLREKRHQYIEFQKLEAETSKIGTFLTAYTYWSCEKKIETFEKDSAKLQSEINSLAQEESRLKNETVEFTEKIKTLESDIKNNNNGFAKLEQECKEFQKQVVKLRAQAEIKSQSIREDEDELQTLQLTRKENLANITRLEHEIQAQTLHYNKLKYAYDTRVFAVTKNQDLLQTLTTGVAAEQGHENGYMDQLQEARTAISVSSCAVEQGKLKLAHLQKELKSLGPKAEEATQRNSSAIAIASGKREELAKMRAQISKMSTTDLQPIKERRDSQLRHVEILKEVTLKLSTSMRIPFQRLSGIEKEIHAYLFNYSNSGTIAKTDVKGIVAQLIRIPDEQHPSATALETCAGGRLFNVVVTSDAVSVKLLDKTQTTLNKKVSIIPLNKIKVPEIDPKRILSAKAMAPGKVDLAVELMEYEQEVENAVKFVFGSTLVCRGMAVKLATSYNSNYADAASAKQVTFAPSVKLKSVTLDGDIYDPQGTLSGGSRVKTKSILLKFQEHGKLCALLDTETSVLHQLNEQMLKAESETQKFEEANAFAELLESECELLEKEISSNSNSDIIRKFESAKLLAQSETAAIEKANSDIAFSKQKCLEIEKNMKRFAGNKEGTLAELKVSEDSSLNINQLHKAEIQCEKKALTLETKTVKEEELKLQSLIQEKVLFEKELEAVNASEAILTSSISSSIEELKQMKETLQRLENESMVKEQELAAERKTLLFHDEEVGQYEKMLKHAQASLSDIQVSLMELKNRLKAAVADHASSVEQLREINDQPENSWINDAKPSFGVKDGRFDFEAQNIAELKKKLQQLGERHKIALRTIDRKVMDQFDRIEKKETALVQKITTVLKDKVKIENTISSLDKFKIDKLLQTWEKVSKDFGMIFGDLLPGNTAKLCPADGVSIESGLEVQVCLGGVWKENLQELSGGQRSLVALSLILALLQFKPAPMYILDEVDSALDDSHTQNIGQLLKTRFNGAQFILVSLKDGMYTNANVLFRTKFRDGVSTIEKYMCPTYEFVLRGLRKISLGKNELE